MQLLCRTADLKPNISCAKCHRENNICTVYYKSEKLKPEKKSHHPQSFITPVYQGKENIL